MAEEVHILLLGFDVQRLVKPLSAGEFSPEKVVIIRDERDPDSGSSSRKDLLEDVQTELNRSLEQYLDVEKEERKLLLSTDFETAFEAFYHLIDDLANGGELKFNVSAAPKSTVLSLQAAREVWLSDNTDDESSLELYYFRPQQYLETDLRARLDRIVDGVGEVAQNQENFRQETESEIAKALTDPISDTIERVEEARTEIESYIEREASPSETEGGDEDTDEGIIDAVTDKIEKVLGDDVDPHEQLTRLRDYIGELDDISTEKEVDPVDIVKGYELYWDEKIRLHRVPDKYTEPWKDSVADLKQRVKTMKESRSNLQGSFGSVSQAVKYLNDQAGDAEALLDKISRAGMTEGIVGDSEDWRVPVAPTADLRDIERIILYILVKRGNQKSVRALAGSTAREIRTIAEQIGGESGETSLPKESMNYCLRIHEYEEVGDDFEEFIADRLRNRLQYNLDSLEESGYVMRVDPEDDRRRREIVLTDTGSLWGKVRNMSEIQRIALEEELRDQLSAFAEQR